MVKTLEIKALNNKGEKALKEHYQETKKMPIRQRLIFRTAGFKQELIDENPFTLSLTINNRHVDNPSYIILIKGEINKGLNLNGAKEGEDYEILEK